MGAYVFVISFITFLVIITAVYDLFTDLKK